MIGKPITHGANDIAYNLERSVIISYNIAIRSRKQIFLGSCLIPENFKLWAGFILFIHFASECMPTSGTPGR